MKRFIGILTALMLCFSVLTCAVAETATGTAQGFHGEVTVTLTVENGDIVACEIVGNEETPSIGGKAIEHYIKAIPASNSVSLDVFSSATYTSNGVLAAAQAALSGLGLTEEDLNAAQNNAAEAMATEADAIVIGAGLSGLTAAIRLQESGKQVILLEKSAMTGGSSRLSGGYLISPNEQCTAQQILDWMNEETASLTERQSSRDENAVLTFLNRCPDALDFLARHNIEMTGPYANLISNQWKDLAANYLPKEEIGSLLTDPLTEQFEAAGGVLYLNTKAETLLTDSGKVVGVNATQGDEPVTLKASDVILATGGYAHNAELVARFMPDFPLDFVDSAVAANSSTGDGILMAEAVGAAVDSVGWFMNYGVYIRDTHTELYNGSDMLLIDGEGNACSKVGQDHREQLWTMNEAYNRTGDAFLVCDEESYGAYTIGEELANGTANCYAADNAEELAQLMNVPADRLAADIEQYNADVEAGADAAFLADCQTPTTTLSGKLYAARVSTSAYATQGGIVVDDACRVQTTDGQTIDGLYAIGETANGKYFNKAYFGGGMLTECIVTALFATDDIVNPVMNTDVLVIGSGLAGVSTALEAADQGLNVLMVEKLAIAGGASMRSDGLYYAANTSIQQAMGETDSTEAMANDALALMTSGLTNDAIIKLWANNSTAGFEWLTEKGVQWENYTFSARLGHPSRVTTAVGYGAGLMETLLGDVQSSDRITLMTETTAAALTQAEDGSVCGATLLLAYGSTATVNAKAVMLATGGFAGSAEMLAAHSDSLIAVSDTNPNTGDGYLLAQSVGAKLQDIPDAITMFFDNESGVSFGAFNPELFLVTPSGERFCDESAHVDDVCHEALVLGLTDIVAIFDEAEFEANKACLEFQLENGTLVKAESVDELATAMGMEPTVLENTITRYNTLCESGVDEDFGKGADYLKALNGTLYAMHFEMNTYETFSGPQINENAQVLDEGGNPISGLYAAGGVTMWQLTDYHYMGCGTSLNNCVVFGRIAAQHMAKTVTK